MALGEVPSGDGEVVVDRVVDASTGGFGGPDLGGRAVAVLEAAAAADPGSPEITDRLNRLVDAQYQGSLDTLKTFHLYDSEVPQDGDVPAPTLEQAKELLASLVTAEQMEAIKQMKKPTLQLIPVTSMARYIEALDSHKPIEGQIDVAVSDWNKRALERADERDGVKDNKSIVGWRIAVTEGAKEPKVIANDDNMNCKIGARATWFKERYEREGVSGVDFKRILLLMMESLSRGEPVNDLWEQSGDGTETFVNEEPEYSAMFGRGDLKFVPTINWNIRKRQVCLESRDTDIRHEKARFRTSVVVDVPKVRTQAGAVAKAA